MMNKAQNMKPIFRELDKKYIEVIGHYDNPVLCAKLTLLAELYAVEHKEGYALFKVEDYDKLSKINDHLDFSVSDLTGTTWVFNEDPVSQFNNINFEKNINFTSGGSNWVAIRVQNFVEDDGAVLSYLSEYNGSLQTYQYAYSEYNLWEDNAYKTIQITGGTDVTDASLIAWLEANATQQVEPEPEPSVSNNLFIGGSAINSIFVGSSEISKIFIGNFELYNAEGGATPSVVSYNVSVTVGTNCSYSGDETIDQNGTATVVLSTSSSSYDLPKTITVTGADYTYDGSTGNIVLSNPTGDVSITCGNAVLNYSITVNLYNCKYNGSNQYSGKISAAGGYRDTLNISLTLDSGYYFSQYSFVDYGAACLVSLANNVLTIQNVSAAYTITLNVVAMGNFKSKTATLTTFKGFNFIETEQGSGSVNYQINFTSNGNQCTQISYSMNNDGQKTSTTTYNLYYTIGGTSTSVATYASGASPVSLTWTNNAYKILTFPNTDQYNDALYYNLVVNCGATFN